MIRKVANSTKSQQIIVLNMLEKLNGILKWTAERV